MNRLFALILFMLLIGLLDADQNLMAPSLTAIGTEFGFTRTEIDQRLGADINLVFWMLGGIVALGIGYLTDRSDLTRRFSRKWMLVVVTLVGQLSCLLSGLAQSYEQLYWARAGTGVAIGGAFPLIYSLLGDSFARERRAVAAGAVGLADGLGIALGQLIAGHVAPTYGWRVPFFLIAIPGMVVTLLFAMAAKEPARGEQERELRSAIDLGHVYKERIRLRDLPAIFRGPTNSLLLLQAIPGTVPWGVFFVYLTDFYHFDKGFPVEVATDLVVFIGGAAILGGLVGGFLGQYLSNKRSVYLPLLCAIATLLAVIPTAMLINYPASSREGVFELVGLGVAAGLLVAVAGPNVNTMLMNVNPPERRGTVFSLFNLCNNLGRGLGASVVGSMAATLGRVSAFHISNLLWVFCGAVLLISAKFFVSDEVGMQRALAQREASGPAMGG